MARCDEEPPALDAPPAVGVKQWEGPWEAPWEGPREEYRAIRRIQFWTAAGQLCPREGSAVSCVCVSRKDVMSMTGLFFWVSTRLMFPLKPGKGHFLGHP